MIKIVEIVFKIIIDIFIDNFYENLGNYDNNNNNNECVSYGKKHGPWFFVSIQVK